MGQEKIDDDSGVFVREFSLIRDLGPAAGHGFAAAAADRQLRLAFQPVLRLNDGQVVGHEALVRRLHPTRGLQSATEMIDDIPTDAGRTVSDWVLTHACRARSRSAAEGQEISVNIAPEELGRGSLTRRVMTALARTGLDAHLLVIELPAQALHRANAARQDEIQNLRAQGVCVGIDNAHPDLVGPEERSLADLMKIDIGAVDARDRSALADWRRMVVDADDFGLRVVAKNIGTDQQLTGARGLGCSLGQGDLLGPPLRDLE